MYLLLLLVLIRVKSLFGKNESKTFNYSRG